MWKIQRSLAPDRLFKAELFKKLNVILDSAYNVRYAWYQTVWFKRATGFASVVLMAGSLGTGAYAYTSPAVTEGSVLYPIKDKLENIEEIIQITPEAKAKFYLKKIERREAEREVLKKKTQATEIKKEIKDAKKNIKLEVGEKIKTEVAKRKIQRTEKSIERAEQQLEKIRQNIDRQKERRENLQKARQDNNKIKERSRTRKERSLIN